MFNDPMISLMFMLLLCFLGMLVMFLYVVRALGAQNAFLREGLARQQKSLDDHERHLMELVFLMRGKAAAPTGKNGAGESAPRPARAAESPAPRGEPSADISASGFRQGAAVSARPAPAKARSPEEEELLAFLDDAASVSPLAGGRALGLAGPARRASPASGLSLGGGRGGEVKGRRLDMILED